MRWFFGQVGHFIDYFTEWCLERNSNWFEVFNYANDPCAASTNNGQIYTYQVNPEFTWDE